MFIGEHTQNGYVCDNLEEAIGQFRARGLERDPMIIPVEQIVQTPKGPKRQQTRICMFRLNGVQYELIEVIVDETGTYANAPANDGVVRFHHVNMKVDDWDTFRASVDQQDFPVAFEGGGEHVKFIYLDARKTLGHYLEYTWMTDAAWDQVRAM